jgi:hypothetical protein
MSGNDTIRSDPSDKSDWSRAWDAVAKLASARESLREIPRAQSLLRPANGEHAPPASAVAAVRPPAILEHDQLAGAIAEIEQASAALRRSEPLLEHGLPAAPARAATRRYWSVWILIGAIWMSASLVVATATGAILYVLG